MTDIFMLDKEGQDMLDEILILTKSQDIISDSGDRLYGTLDFCMGSNTLVDDGISE